MDITCKNKKCGNSFKLDISDLESESTPSGNHTTQYLVTGTIYCPSCKHEMEIEYIYDELNDTGETLSESVQSLT